MILGTGPKSVKQRTIFMHTQVMRLLGFGISDTVLINSQCVFVVWPDDSLGFMDVGIAESISAAVLGIDNGAELCRVERFGDVHQDALEIRLQVE